MLSMLISHTTSVSVASHEDGYVNQQILRNTDDTCTIVIYIYTAR